MAPGPASCAPRAPRFYERIREWSIGLLGQPVQLRERSYLFTNVMVLAPVAVCANSPVRTIVSMAPLESRW